ncbi:BTB/POZ domain protein [Toxoplasma gondii MAS]|uniref:BTB/POZ domain protein n=1 Tax=Toxoplasma gondii MAS TaxID=943118 RepID=A0A086QZH9_TOXGO|nr:BTB/POZ domain protein [Toxoplasma gondii MAS]
MDFSHPLHARLRPRARPGGSGSGAVQEIYTGRYRMSYGCHFAAASAHDSSVYVVEHDFKIYRLINPSSESPSPASAGAEGACVSSCCTYSSDCPFSQRQSGSALRGETERHLRRASDERRHLRGGTLPGELADEMRASGELQKEWRKQLLVDVIPYLFCNHRKEYSKLFTGNKQFDVPRMRELRRSCCLMANSCDGMLYLLLHHTLFRISLSGVMTPVANLVQAATALLREHRSRPLLLCPPRDAGASEERRGPSRRNLSRAQDRERRERASRDRDACAGVDTGGRQPRAKKGVSASDEDWGFEPRGVRTPQEEARRGFSSRAARPSDGRARREACGSKCGVASASSRPLSPKSRDSRHAAARREKAREETAEEEDFFSNLSFHTRLDGADPTSALEVATCCIDGRGWCFFTVQGTDDASRSTLPFVDSVRPASRSADEGPPSERKPEGVLLCLDTGAVTPVIHPVFLPTTVDPARVFLPSVAAHPVGGITCAVGQAAVTIRKPEARRRSRREREHAEVEDSPDARSRARVEIRSKREEGREDGGEAAREDGGEESEEKEGEEGGATAPPQGASGSVREDLERRRGQRQRERGDSKDGEQQEEEEMEGAGEELRVQRRPAGNRAAGLPCGDGEPLGEEAKRPARRQTEEAREDTFSAELGEGSPSPRLSARGGEENCREIERETEQGSLSEGETRTGDAPQGLPSFFSSFTSPGCTDTRRDWRGASAGASSVAGAFAAQDEGDEERREEKETREAEEEREEEEERDEEEERGEEEDREEEEREEEEREEEERRDEEEREEEGTRSDWWFYPVDEDEPWSLVPMMEVMNNRDLHELAQQTTLNFGGSLENSVCIYAFDRYSACCWLLWQPGHSVREQGRGETAVSLECAYLIQLPAELYWQEAQRCLLALRAKQRADRRRRRELARRRREETLTLEGRGRSGEDWQRGRSDEEASDSGEEGDEAFMASAAAALFGPGAADTALVPGVSTPGEGYSRSAGAPPALLHIISQDARHLEVREMLPTSTGHLLIMAEAGNKLKKSSRLVQVGRRVGSSPSSPGGSLARASTIAARAGTLHDAGSEQGSRGSQLRRADSSSSSTLASGSLFASLSSTLAWAAAPSGTSPRSEGDEGVSSEAAGISSSMPTAALARRLQTTRRPVLGGSLGEALPIPRRGTAVSATASRRLGARASARLPPMTAAGVATAGDVPRRLLSGPGAESALQQSHIVLAAAADPEGDEDEDCDAVVLFLLDGLLQCEAPSFWSEGGSPGGAGREGWGDSALSRHPGTTGGCRRGIAPLSTLLGESSASSQAVGMPRHRETYEAHPAVAGFSRGLNPLPAREAGTQPIPASPLRASSAPSAFRLSLTQNARSLCCFCRLRREHADSLSLSDDFFGLWTDAAAPSATSSGRLVLHRNFLDVEICCSDGVRLPSHRALLAAKSAFFEAMLTGACVWREQEPQSDCARGRRDGIWVLNLPSHSSRVVAPILQYLATDKLTIPSRCCCSRCCPFLSETSEASDAGTAGGADPCCSRCMYAWLLELFSCAEFCLLQPLQLEVLHLACRCINKHSAVFALCSPWTAPHPRLLRFAAQTLMLHFPCPSAFLRPLPSVSSNAALGTRRHSGELVSALTAERRGVSQHLEGGREQRKERREGEGRETPLCVLARAPVLPHVFCAINAWFLTSPVCSPVVAQLVQQLLSARKPLCRRTRAKSSNSSGGESELLQTSLGKATLLFSFGYRLCLPGYSPFSPDILLVLPELSETQAGPRDRSTLLPWQDEDPADCGYDPMHWPGKDSGVRTLEDQFSGEAIHESCGLVEIWGKALGLSRDVRRRVERELQGIIAATR